MQPTNPITVDVQDIKDILRIGSILAEILNGKPVSKEEETQLHYATRLLADLLHKFNRYSPNESS